MNYLNSLWTKSTPVAPMLSAEELAKLVAEEAQNAYNDIGFQTTGETMYREALAARLREKLQRRGYTIFEEYVLRVLVTNEAGKFVPLGDRKNMIDILIFRDDEVKCICELKYTSVTTWCNGAQVVGYREQLIRAGTKLAHNCVVLLVNFPPNESGQKAAIDRSASIEDVKKYVLSRKIDCIQLN